MDGVTQQNASLVEEAAAAAGSMASATQELANAIRVFNLGGAPQALRTAAA